MKEQIFLTVLLVSCISIAFAQTAMKNFKRFSVMGILIFYLVFGKRDFHCKVYVCVLKVQR